MPSRRGGQVFFLCGVVELPKTVECVANKRSPGSLPVSSLNCMLTITSSFWSTNAAVNAWSSYQHSALSIPSAAIRPTVRHKTSHVGPYLQTETGRQMYACHDLLSDKYLPSTGNDDETDCRLCAGGNVIIRWFDCMPDCTAGTHPP